MMSSEVTSAAAMKEVELQREVEEEELELGLSLGANTTTTSSRKHHYCCRILTAKDFPPPAPESSSSSSSSYSSAIKRAPQPPSQVVGWPPIRAFRMNSLVSLQHSKPNDNAADNKKKNNRGHGHGHTCRFVKVNKDGDPIGRKVDLGAHTSYETLAVALELMFRKPTAPAPAPSSDSSTNASKLLLGGSSEFALTYKDKDGDWMLVGDVPYGMFLDTVKRLRIMRTSDASGLAPRFQPSTSVELT